MQAYVRMSVCHAKNFNGVQACNQCENSDIGDGGNGGNGGNGGDGGDCGDGDSDCDDNDDDYVSNGSHSLDPCLICINTGGSV